jgi:hypothetical protein
VHGKAHKYNRTLYLKLRFYLVQTATSCLITNPCLVQESSLCEVDQNSLQLDNRGLGNFIHYYSNNERKTSCGQTYLHFTLCSRNLNNNNLLRSNFKSKLQVLSWNWQQLFQYFLLLSWKIWSVSFMRTTFYQILSTYIALWFVMLTLVLWLVSPLWIQL